MLSRLPGNNYSAEIQRTTVETNTDVVSGLGELRTELVRLRRGLAEVAAAEGLGIASAGTAPRSVFADFELTATGRYGRMQEQYRLLVDEQLICGLQIHVGVSNRDLAVQIMQRVARHLRSCWPCRPARRSGTDRTLATRASGRSSGSAGPVPGRPVGSSRRRSTRSCSTI